MDFEKVDFLVLVEKLVEPVSRDVPRGHSTRRSTQNSPKNLRSKNTTKSPKNQQEIKKNGEGKYELKNSEDNLIN